MEYTLKVFIGHIEYRTFTLRASIRAAQALMDYNAKALDLFSRKITELADTYSWTHAEYCIAGVTHQFKR